MKKIVFSLVFVLVISLVNAQSDWRMGVAALPGVASSGGYGFVFGADVRLQKQIEPKTHFILTTGVTHFFKKNNVTGAGYIPLKAGAKYFLEDHFYAAGEIGIGFGTVKNSGRSFIWSPSVGLSFKTVDISVKYEDAPNFTFANGVANKYMRQFALRVAYGFSLN